MTRHQRLTLIAAILGSGVASIDGSIVNVALPSIERSLGGGLSVQQWISNGYLLTLGSLILIGGSLGDIFGDRRVFMLGAGAFGVCSVICAAAPNAGVLLGARVLQGAAGAMLVPSSLAAIISAFPPQERGAAIGSWTAFGAISQVVGPLLGGLIVDSASWRWIFLINVPLVLITLWLIAAALPRAQATASVPSDTGSGSADPRSPNRPARHRPIDVTGATLCMLGLGGIVFALIEQPHEGWGSPLIFLPLAVGAAVFAGFLLWERRSAHPMVDLSLFTNRNFSVGNLETAVMYAGLGGLIFFLQIFLQQVARYSALDSGLSTLPLTLIMFLTSRRFGALAGRFGPRFFMGAGPIIAAVGIALLARAGLHTPYLTVLLPALLIFALGLSMTVAPLTATVLAAAEESNAGIASAINNAVARIASLIAVSSLGLVAAGALHGDSFTHSPASVQAFHRLIYVCATLVAAGGVAGALGIVSPGRGQPDPGHTPAGVDSDGRQS